MFHEMIGVMMKTSLKRCAILYELSYTNFIGDIEGVGIWKFGHSAANV